MISQDINKMFDVFVSLRKKNIELIDTVAPDKMTVIPKRLRNNILWHAGHIVVVQASLLHLRLEMPGPVPKSWLPYFAKGSSPDDWDENLPSASEVRIRSEMIGRRRHPSGLAEPSAVRSGTRLCPSIVSGISNPLIWMSVGARSID